MLKRNSNRGYSNFEDELVRISSYSAGPEDIVYIKNHQKVLSGLVGGEFSYYYIENGHFVRNSWVKLDDKYVYFNAGGNSRNNMIDGFTTLGEKLGINRAFHYDKESNSERTYYVASLSSYTRDREYNEDEFNRAVDNGDIVFKAIEDVRGTGAECSIGLMFLSDKKELMKEYRQVYELD